MLRFAFILLGSALLAQTPQARIKIDTERIKGEVHPHIFGNFAEHLGRCIYEGIYDPGNPLSDADGFRKTHNLQGPIDGQTDAVVCCGEWHRVPLNGWHDA